MKEIKSIAGGLCIVLIGIAFIMFGNTQRWPQRIFSWILLFPLHIFYKVFPPEPNPEVFSGFTFPSLNAIILTILFDFVLYSLLIRLILEWCERNKRVNKKYR